jgi:hypothetical protein
VGALLSLSPSGGQGFAATVGKQVPDLQQDQIERSLRCAQLRTNEQVDWTRKPQLWMDRFMHVYSSQSGWGDWTIKGLRLPDPLAGERLLQRLARALKSLLEKDEIQAVQRGVDELDRLIKAGDPIARPFQSAQRRTEKTAISFGSADLKAGEIVMTCGFAYFNINQTVDDFILGEKTTTWASVQCAALTTHWVQKNFDMFEPKINEYLNAKKKQMFKKIEL